ncbi:MAG: alpha-1,2-fucosyltransferase, partial [Verrucomicrobiota bacterium]
MNRILIGALSCRSYEDRRERCRRTWIPDPMPDRLDLVFLVGDEKVGAQPRREQDILRIPCSDIYEALPSKTQGFCRWALEHEAFDYLFKCDDDTYIHVERFLDFDPEDKDYIGAEWTAGAGYASGGAGYLLSRKAASIIAEHDDFPHGAEDVLVGETLRSANIHFDINRRFIPYGNEDLRPRRDNDLITSHAHDAPWAHHDAEWGGIEPRVFCTGIGRLGNTMFQIAATLAYAGRFGTHKPVFDLSNYGEYASNLFRNLPAESGPEPHVSLSEESDFSYREFEHYPDRHVRISGYVQSERFFDDHAEAVRDVFSISPADRDTLMGKYGHLLKGTTVSLHVRRGDYVEKQEYHPLVSPAYYQGGLELIRKQHDVDRVICFSDDPS